MHFPAEIAVLKNNADDTFQKHLWDHMATGPAKILILFRIFSENRLLYKRFYKNICHPFLLSTIPYFSSTFKDFYIIYSHLTTVQNIKKQPFLRIAVSYLPLFSSLCNNVLHTLFIRSSLSTYCSCAKNPASAHAKLASIPYSISLTLLSFFLTNLANY